MFFLLSFLSLVSLAAEPLDPAPRRIHPVVTLESMNALERNFLDEFWPSKSDLKAVVRLQTPVKAQEHRGTCSIFSSTAMVESLIKARSRDDIDLAENYLQFIVMAKIKEPEEGSDTDWNMDAFKEYGSILEEAWPYEGWDWNEEDIPAAEKKRRTKTCSRLKGRDKDICRLSHLNPKKDPHSDAALGLGEELELPTLSYEILDTEKEVKQLLNKKVPVVLGLEFFYRAWNHRLMPEYGLGERDMEAWAKGVVSTPDEEDIAVSRRHGAGHSIVVVGFDDKKKVYYFKNSWGSDSFGVTSDLLGADSTAGYGSISFEYAHNHGTFHRVQFE